MRDWPSTDAIPTGANHVSRANRRDDSGKSTPVTNHATTPHPIAKRTALRRNESIGGMGEPATVVTAAPATTVKMAIHW